MMWAVRSDRRGDVNRHGHASVRYGTSTTRTRKTQPLAAMPVRLLLVSDIGQTVTYIPRLAGRV
jgi:hypothetical protein